MLRSAKDGVGLRVPGVYRIPLECGNVYLGHSGRTVEDRCNEHKRYIRQHQPEKSAVADHRISTGHCFNFFDTLLLDLTSGYVDGLVKEAVEIRLTKNDCNTDGSFILVTYNRVHERNSRTTQSRYLTPPTDTLVSLTAMCQGWGHVYHDKGGIRRESVS
jgi:hypothetical protein